MLWDKNNLISYGTNIYEYNTFNIRTKKTSNTHIHEYTLEDTKIIKEQIKDKNNTLNITFEYIYDEQDMLMGLIYNNNVYYYDKDVTGIINGIIDINGNYVVKYTYTAYGEVEKEYSDGSIVSEYNSFQYKGYYYDVETQLFYCNSRYYSPELCRFISPDDVEYLDLESVNGLNLYCYCMNNPIMYADPSGRSAIVAMLIGAGIGLAAGLASQVASDVVSNVWVNGFDFSEWQMSSWQSYVGAGLGGAIGGMFTPLFGAVAVGFITGTASTAITMGLSNATGATNYGFGEIVASSLLMGMVSGLTAGIVDNIKIPKLNAGRNSLNAISKQINTKLINGTINNVSDKTLRKMFTLSFLYSAPFTTFNTAFTILNMKG